MCSHNLFYFSDMVVEYIYDLTPLIKQVTDHIFGPTAPACNQRHSSLIANTISLT